MTFFSRKHLRLSPPSLRSSSDGLRRFRKGDGGFHRERKALRRGDHFSAVRFSACHRRRSPRSPHAAFPVGAESHSFEPTPGDAITVSECDLFAYVGGEIPMPGWKRFFDSVDTSNKEVVTLMDCVDTVAEETVEGMETHGHVHDHEGRGYGPRRGFYRSRRRIPRRTGRARLDFTEKCNADCPEALRCALPPRPGKRGRLSGKHCFIPASLTSLDEEFSDVTANASRHTIVFGDRFPFRYFADAYGLDYYAAFPGCESEASAKTLSF